MIKGFWTIVFIFIFFHNISANKSSSGVCQTQL